MPIPTVTILVQQTILVLALIAAGFGWWKAYRFKQCAEIQLAEVRLRSENEHRLNGKIIDLTAANERLKQQVSQIPLAPAPKKRDDGPVKARSAAQVRQLTEDAWGQKPEIGEQNVQ